MRRRPTEADLMDFAERVLGVGDPYAFVHQNPEFVTEEFGRRGCR